MRLVATPRTYRNETLVKPYILYFIVLYTLLFRLQPDAMAAQWQTLDGTARYMVAYDEQSIQRTTQGLLEIRLRFIPRRESVRKSAAVEYKDKRYRSHLELYEIDCSEQTALRSLVDVLGSSGVRLKQLKGGTLPDQILPGSVLYNAAQLICPVTNDNFEEGIDTIDQAQIEEPEITDDKSLDRDKQELIENLQKKASSKGATADTWKELGNVYFDTDQPEQAIKAYDQALALLPDDTNILNDQGAMYRQAGNFQKAVANFESAYTIDPTNLESLYNCAYVYAFDLNNMPKALILWRNYLEMESKGETAQQVRSFIEKYGK